MDEEDPYVKCVLFPIPYFEKETLQKYKSGIIQIPTERKNPETNAVEKIPCYFQKNPNSKNILIIFHGNGSDFLNLPYYLPEISQKYNINILLPEYPGYSIYRSPISHEKCLENSLIIYDYILHNIKNITENNIYVLGRSLGSSVAIYLGSKRNPAGVFTISAFTTFASVGVHDEETKKSLINFFRSIDYVDKINSPILFVHGKEDPLVKYEESKILYEKCNGNIKKKEIILIEHMAHNFSYEKLKNDIIPPIADFAEKYCSLNKEKNNDELIIDFEKNIFISDDEINIIIDYFNNKLKKICW